METVNAIIRDMDSSSELFLSKLSDVEHVVMEAVADNDDALADGDVDAVAEASAVAVMLFTAAHAIATGLTADSPIIQQRVREAMVGLSTLAGRAFPSEDHDDGTWEVQ